MAIVEGKAALPFTLPDADGGEVSLADFRGKDVILYFYPRDDTPGCTKEACGFRDLQGETGKLGAVVMGVSPDSPESHRRFAGKFGLPFALLADPEKRVLRGYGAWGKKVLYGRESLGVIRSTVWIGPDGRVVRHWKRIKDAAAHPAEVLQAMRERSSPG